MASRFPVAYPAAAGPVGWSSAGHLDHCIEQPEPEQPSTQVLQQAMNQEPANLSLHTRLPQEWHALLQ